jgi:hypothetical protein
MKQLLACKSSLSSQVLIRWMLDDTANDFDCAKVCGQVVGEDLTT